MSFLFKQKKFYSNQVTEFGAFVVIPSLFPDFFVTFNTFHWQLSFSNICKKIFLKNVLPQDFVYFILLFLLAYKFLKFVY